MFLYILNGITYFFQECAVTGQKYTYQQLLVSIKNLSNSLRKILKLEKNDKVAILSKNSPDYVVSAFGIIRSGCILTTLNPLYTPGKQSFYILLVI